jgi:hypothetical protein
MRDDFDELLKSGLLAPPEDFAHRVMQRIAGLPLPELPAQPRGTESMIQWIALVGAGLIGAAQLAAFMFGIWTAAAAS